MKLMTAKLRRSIPPLYSQEQVKGPTVQANWTWLVTEGEERDGDYLFFGYVIGHEPEWGYFVLSELERARPMTSKRLYIQVATALAEVRPRVPGSDHPWCVVTRAMAVCALDPR